MSDVTASVVNAAGSLVAAAAVVLAGGVARRRTSSRVARWALDAVRVLAVTLAAASVAAEVVARRLVDTNTVIARNHYEAYLPGRYALRRDARWEGRALPRWHGFSVRTNEDGLRGDEHRPPPSPPPDERRVLFLGDSWTFGLGLEEPETYPARVGAQLSAVTPLRWRVLNGGVPGFNVFSAVDRFEWLAPRYRPHVVVFTVGEFDDVLPDVNTQLRLRESAPQRWLRRFALYRVLRRMQAYRRYRVELDAEGEYGPLRTDTAAHAQQRRELDAAAQRVMDAARRVGCQVLFHMIVLKPPVAPRPGSLPSPESPLRTFRDHGARFEVTLWDPSDRSLVIPDDGHPSDAGAEVLARTVVDAVRTLAP